MTPSIGVSLLWFLAIVALIPLALWLLKRTPIGGMGGMGGDRNGLPRAVSVLPLSTQHKLVTVEVGQGEERVWLVLGVSPQGLRTLHTMSPLPEAQAAVALPPGAAFAQLLARMRGERKNGDSGDAR
jgi:flagellar protein FliO/FliZ